MNTKTKQLNMKTNGRSKANRMPALTDLALKGADINDLRSKIKGRVIMPDDADYAQACTIFYGGIDRKPAAIVRVADAQDVAGAVTLARESGLELAVRSGGHCTAGHGLIGWGHRDRPAGYAGAEYRSRKPHRMGPNRYDRR